MKNPTTPASGDALSDVRLLELAAETDLARDYDGSGYVESTCREGADITASVLAFARAAIAADRAARQAPAAPLQQAQDGERLDAARYRWLRDRFLGADFDWNENGIAVLLFKVARDTKVFGDSDLTVDAARAAGGEEQK